MSIDDRAASRRDFLDFAAHGIGSTALMSMLCDEASSMAPPATDRVATPHAPPRIRRMVHVIATGGVSQIDTFDYKPQLDRLHGKPLVSKNRPDVFFGKVGLLRKSDWAFRRRGRSGLWVSDLFPHLAEVADELTIIKSMVAETSNHTPATFQENTGFRLNGFPVLGAWLSYGLGCESENLPAHVVIPDPRGFPAGGSINWTSGFLPAQHQGVALRAKGLPIDDLVPARTLPRGTEADTRVLLASLNRRHVLARRGDDALLARIRSYELAARMQLAVPEVTALDGETRATQELYGLHRKPTAEFGRGCLLARRLLQSGVRFVQLYSGGAFGRPRHNWDGHEDMVKNHGREAARVDRPLAALIKDLRRTGLLDDTLILFTSEFGRTPFTQSNAGVLGTGRDHNQDGFSVWMAGGGLRGGLAYGSTDVFGWKAQENITSWHDLHATLLHLLGLDHEQLTFYHNGIQRRLTNVHGRVIEALLE
ncbi:MAG: DUF1501 domain-containing protein [Planctomycetaceae bacterium]|nr:DUF1501 domain-containing protein [Planctomycetaceae bacterium]